MSAPGVAASRICRNTTSVKVQTFLGTGAVPCTETREKFPVLVRVTAAAAAEQQISGAGAGLDIVAVLDVGGSMSGDKLKRLKDAMIIFINRLGPEDRLSIVSLGSDVRREMELTGMSDQGRKAAKDVVKRLPTQGGASMGLRAPPAALHEGAQILRERQNGEKSTSRVGCIVFLSDSLDTQIFDDDASMISSDFPVHTLGLGADHDPKALKRIADKTSGTYSFANKDDMAKIKDTCALFTSVPATSVEITLRAHEGAFISSSQKSSDDKIRIGNMYAGEKKNFIVYLALEATAEGEQKLLTIGGRYQNLSESKDLADAHVSVMRPDEKSSKTSLQVSLGVLPDVVAAVLAQIKMLLMVIAGSVPRRLGSPNLITPGNLWPTAAATTRGVTSRLQQVWQDACHSTEGKIRNAPETMRNIEAAGYQKMTRGINNLDRYKVWSGLPCYRLSWPRISLKWKWRRATTKNNEPEPPKTGDAVLAPGQEPEEIVQDGNHGNTAATAAASSSTTTSSSTTLEEIRARARRHPCSRLRPGVAVVLVLTSLLMMMLYSSGLEGSSLAKGMRAQLQYPMLLFSKSNYAAWGANKAIDPKQVPARKDLNEMEFQLSGEKQDNPAWEAAKVTDETLSPGQGCCGDNADDKCGQCHGRDHDTYRESDLVAKILDIILSSVKGKENELKSLLVQARYDHE